MEDKKPFSQKIQDLYNAANKTKESFDMANKNLDKSIHILGKIHEDSIYKEAQADQQLRWEEHSKAIIEVSLESTKRENKDLLNR